MKLWRITRAPLSGRRLASCGAAAVIVLSVAACGAGGTSDDASGDGGSLTVLVEGGGKAELQPVAEAFTEETGTQVTFVELPYDGLYDRLSSELSSGNVSFDVAALDAIWLPTFADGVQPLDDLFTDDVRGDLFPALIEEAQVGDKFVGMPAWTNAEVLYYRTDLFDDAAEKDAFKAEYGYDLAPPTDWQQFEDMAKFFTRDTDGDGATDLYGTDVKGAVETEWLATVLQSGADGMVLDDEGNVIVDDAAHLAALDFYSKLNTDAKVSPPGASQIDWAAAQNLFNQGQTAMMRFWAHAYTQIPEDASVAGNVGVTVLPGGEAGTASVPGAWYLSVPTATEQTDLATQFVQFAYDHNELGIETDLGLAARKSALEGFADQEGHENLTPLIDALEAPATAPRPAVAEWQQIVDTVLVPMLQKSVEDSSNNQQLLDEAKAQIEDILG